MAATLPHELLRLIVNHLWDDRPSLVSLLFTSKAWSAEAERVLYGTLPFPRSWERTSVPASHPLVRRHLGRLILRGESLGFLNFLHNADQLKVLELGGNSRGYREETVVNLQPLLAAGGCNFRLTSFAITDMPINDVLLQFLKEQQALKELSIAPINRPITDITGKVVLRPDDLPRLRRLETPLELTPYLKLGERRRLTHVWVKVIGGGKMADEALTSLAQELASVAGTLQTLLTDNTTIETLSAFVTSLPNLWFLGYCPPCWDEAELDKILEVLSRLKTVQTIAFHERDVAKWVDKIKGALPQVKSVLIPTLKPRKQRGDTSEDEEENKIVTDFLPAETFWAKMV